MIIIFQFPSWFDRDLYVHEPPEMKHSIDVMCNKVSELIHREIASGIPMNRIIVAGFSRGGRLAMHLAYRFKKGLAGCIVMSSSLNMTSLVYEVIKRIIYYEIKIYVKCMFIVSQSKVNIIVHACSLSYAPT